jgi:hypothetical protein
MVLAMIASSITASIPVAKSIKESTGRVVSIDEFLGMLCTGRIYQTKRQKRRNRRK